MEQLNNFGDERVLAGCLYCGGPPDSREHVPAKVLLDNPLPENLPVVSACYECNSSFSLDEEYLACLLECVLCGSVSPKQIQRKKIRKILERKPALATMIEESRRVNEGGVSFDIDVARVRRVIVKLAQGHAAFELNEKLDEDPLTVSFFPLHLLTAVERKQFEKVEDLSEFLPWPEVGSRAMQRAASSCDFSLTTSDLCWIEVQPRRYRYLTVAYVPVEVRMVLSEYLGCRVTWSAD